MGISPLDALAEGRGERLQELLRLGAEEARRLGHHFVGTGHVAVAAVRISAHDASIVSDARSRLEGLLGLGAAEPGEPRRPTPRLVQLVEACGVASGTDDADARDFLAMARRLEPPVAKAVLGE